ncbi:MAG: TIGR02147 family protein [Bdellovibrionaceae bacterium]|nr:TIGR02147 family protein [Pseudobdellovibrionaceae bacterium]
MIDHPSIRILNQVLADRKAKNPAYSLRALARDLGIGATSLSDALNGKRQLSKTSLRRMAEKLELSPLERDQIFSHSQLSKLQFEEVERLELKEDTFRLIADWYYLAIMNLGKMKNCRADAKWLANRLGISQVEAHTALDRLLRLNLVETRRGRLVRTARPLATSRDIPSEAVRRHHRGNLQLAEKALDETPVELREFSSTTVATNPKNLKKAKDYLMKAKHRVAAILESGEPTEVYTLSFQLFPLTEVKGENQ